MAVLRGVGDAGEAQGLVEIGGKDGALQRSGSDRRRKEKALKEGAHQPEVGAHLLPEARGGEPVGAAVHAGLCAADVSADGGESAAWIFNERAHHHIRPHIRGLLTLHKLPVAVVHHTDHIGLDGLAEGDQFPDLLHGEGGAGGVALGALNGDQLGLGADGGADGVIVKGPIRLQIHLPVGHAVFR